MTTLGVSQALAQVCPTPTPTPPCAPTPTPSCGTCVLTTPTYTPAASPTAIATPAAFSASLPSTTTQAGTGQFQNVQTLNMTANNAAIPTLNAGTIRTRQILSAGSESKYASFGSRWYLKPRTEALGLSFLFAPAPHHRSTTGWIPSCDGVANSWSPVTTQAIYHDDMWPQENQATCFAPNTIFMAGSITNTISNLESGVGKTRVIDEGWTPAVGWPFKYTVGTMSQAQLVRPGTKWDFYSCVGGVQFAYTSFPKSTGSEPDSGLKRVYANFLSGAELGSFIGRWIGPDLSTPVNIGPMDGRQASLKEDDFWAPAPAVVNYMAGTTNQAWVDNKRVGFCIGNGTPSPTPGCPNPNDPTLPGANIAGKVGYAVGTRSAVLASVNRSWVNVDMARGVTASLGLGESLASPEGYFCNDERIGSRIGSWIGIESGPISYNLCKTKIYTAAGSMIADMSPLSGGGAPAMALPTEEPAFGQATAHEAHTSLIARGEVVVGDGASDQFQNYDTDVLHVKDVIRLAGRRSPPTFSETTPPSDRVGLLYYDITRNALRVSLAMEREEPGDWRDAEVVWVDVATADDRITPDDVVGSRRPSQLQPAEILDQTLIAGGLAAVGVSQFIEPRVSVVVTSPSELRSDTLVPCCFFLTGFQGKTPRIMWKRIGSGPNKEGELGWQEAPCDVAASNDPEMGMLTVALPLATPGTVGVPGQLGDIVQFVIIHPVTGQATATSVRL